MFSFYNFRPCISQSIQSRAHLLSKASIQYRQHRHLHVLCNALQESSLGNSERKALRSEANRLAAAKRLVTVTLGKSGMTSTFIEGLTDALVANQLVKVRVSGACDEDDIVERLCVETGSLMVQTIGNTVTLYRPKESARTHKEKDPAKPSAMPSATKQTLIEEQEIMEELEEEDVLMNEDVVEEQEEEEEGSEEEHDHDDWDDEADRDFYIVPSKGPRAPQRKQKPPEFTIITS